MSTEGMDMAVEAMVGAKGVVRPVDGAVVRMEEAPLGGTTVVPADGWDWGLTNVAGEAGGVGVGVGVGGT